MLDTIEERTAFEKVINQDNETAYDADANQRIRFTTELEDAEVDFHFSPVTDERYIEFDRDSRLKLVDNASFLLPENTKALVKLWNDVCFDIEGIEGEKPQNWKEEIDESKEKIPSISDFLAVSAYTEAHRSWGQTDQSVTTEAYFNNRITKQKHFLRKKTIDDIKAYRKFQRIPLGNRSKGLESSEIIFPSFAEDKAALYDRMRIKAAEGYANRVPLWHKVAVVDAVFASGLTQKK